VCRVPLDKLTHGSLFDLVAVPQSITVLKRLLARNVDLSAMRDLRRLTLCHYVVLNAKDDGDFVGILRAVLCLNDSIQNG
jgi:hypothetical protein